jgi:dienelactone hydrolase
MRIPAAQIHLAADLHVPERAIGVVIFAHGTGSGRFSPRNRYVAAGLHAVGMATVLLDLLTPVEEEIDATTRHLRFDISLLAQRLVAVTDWARQQPELRRLPIGYFGASTGAAAALIAAAERPASIAAVVSRGGRPDLAHDRLAEVRAPTLLIVGGNDPVVIQLNREALAALRTEKQITIVPGATHLFEEPGTLEQVTRLARNWFVGHMAPVRATPA